MKKILTVSFVALISVISAGNAAIPDKTYVDDTAAGLAAAAESSAKAYADSLAKNYDAAGAAATAQTNAVEYTDAEIDKLAEIYETKENVSTAVQVAKDYASDEADAAENNAKAYAVEELLKKVDKEGHTASQVVITNSTGTITTAAQIPNTQVSGLGALATKSTIANADVAADAAIAQSKIAGLTDALAAKVDDSQVIAEAGTVTNADAEIPTIARMNAAIANAKPDTSGLVDKAAVVVSGGTHTMTGATVANDANKDTYVPTVAYAQQMAELAAGNAVDGMNAKFQEYVPYAMGEAHADGFVVTDATGNVYVEHGVPASITDAMDEKVSAKLNKPVGECLTPGNCVLVLSEYGENGELILVWEKVARSISDVQAE